MKVRVTPLCPTLRLHGLCSLWNSPRHNTRVGNLSLLQGIFPTQVSCTAGGFFTSWATRGHVPETMLNDQEMLAHLVLPQAYESESEVTQWCLTLCNPVDCSPPGSSVHGILQARTLERVAISFSRGSSRPRDQTQVSHMGGRRFNLWATREAWGSVYYLPVSDEETAGSNTTQEGSES